MKIYGFYHVLLKNHWQEIVAEQISCIVNSGLYETSEKIYIGAIGSEEDLNELYLLLGNNSKFLVTDFGEDASQFEFPTLDLVKHFSEDVNEKTSIFYIHTKGASFEKSNLKAKQGNDNWRHYMNSYNLMDWKNALHEIESGADLVGVKWREKISTGNILGHPHFSGNFFWTHSDYVKKLPAIDSLDKSNRYNAEFWHGMANPKAVSLCQDFVDANANRNWKPPTERRNIVHTLCWNTFEQCELAVTDLYARNNKKDFIHVLVDLGFPLENGDEIPNDLNLQRDLNTNKLMNLAEKFGSIYFRAENIGVSQNWTQVARFMKITEHDILLCADPDERVQTDGWVKAICDVMRYNKKYAWLSLKMPEYDSVLTDANKKEYKYWDIKVWEIIGNLNWAQGGMSGELIKKMGGVIPHPHRYGIYGGLESATMVEIKKNRMTWGVLADHVVVHTNEVPLLREWKDICIFKLKEYGRQIPFEEFLKMKKEKVL